MDEEFWSEFASSPVGPMALAFLFGILFGWVVWGWRRRRASPAAAAAEGGEASAAAPDDAREIIVIKAELKAVRTLLDETDEQEESVKAHLSALDETMKRVNARLKSLLSAVRQATGRG